MAGGALRMIENFSQQRKNGVAVNATRSCYYEVEAISHQVLDGGKTRLQILDLQILAKEA